MTGPTRVAGWGRGPDGTVVTWTVAEGRRGRRWREVVARDTDVVHTLLLDHFFNHQTHHRGQVHALLTGFGIKPGATDMPFGDNLYID